MKHAFLFLSSFCFGAFAVANQVVWDINSLNAIGGFPVTFTGSPMVISTPEGNAVEFNPAIESDPAPGTGDRLQIQGNPLGTDTEFTIEMVFKPYSSSAPLQPRVFHICQPDSAAGGARTMTMETRSSNLWYGDFFIKSVNGSGIIDATKTHPADQWMHMAMTYKSGVIKGYVNGALDATYASTGNFYTGLPATAEVSLGGRMQGKYYFRGAVRKLVFTPQALEPADFTFTGVTQTILAKNMRTFTGYTLSQNYPNPVITRSAIGLSLQKKQTVQLDLYNSGGIKVRTLFSGEAREGTHTVSVNADNLISGIYFYTIRASNGFQQTRLMQILKKPLE
jgi:Concanavalin A-like lectin/glucanases superfamily/Secretion system C-terminal sorting domain